MLQQEFVLNLEGREVRLPWPTFGTRDAYAGYLRRRGVADLFADSKQSPPDLQPMYAVMRADISDSYSTGHFDWGANGFRKSLASPRNLQQLILLWLGQVSAQLNGSMPTEQKLYELWPTHEAEFYRVINEVLEAPNSGAGREESPAGTSAPSAPGQPS
jgi:hypothetical protein